MKIPNQLPKPSPTLLKRENVLRFFGLAAMALLVASAPNSRATSDSWVGGTDALWANSANWSTVPATVPGTGDDAIFNANGGFTTIDLGGGVTINNVQFYDGGSGVSAYTIGSAAGQTLTLQTGINMAASVANNQLFNANIAYSTTGTQTIYNDSANTLTLAGTNSAASAGIKIMKVDGAGNTVVSGLIASGAGTMNLEKTGTGTLTLSGGATWSGNGVNEYLPGSAPVPAVLRAGTIIMNGGSYTNNGEFTVGGVVANGGAGDNVSLTLNGARLVITSGNWFSLGRGNGIGGVSSDVVLSNNASIVTANGSLGFNPGTGNFAKGTLTLNDTSFFTANGNFYLAESAGQDMTMTLNGSACFTNVNAAGVSIGRTGKGTVLLNGTGTLFTEGDAIIGYSPNAPDYSRVVVNGGTLKVASTTKRWLQIGRAGSGSGMLVVSNGAVKLCQNTDIRFTTSTSTGTNSITLAGGEITFYSDNAATPGGTGQLDLQQASAAGVHNTFNLNGGTITVSNIVSSQVNGTRIFNFNGGTLKAVSAPASGTVNFMNLGSGNALAFVRNGGAVIDSNGKDITVAQPLLHSAIAGDAATDGGLNKNGTGPLTMLGVNTYTGPTRVNQGTLNINGSSLNSSSLVVGDGATFGLQHATVSQWAPTTMTVGTNTGGAVVNIYAGTTSLAPLAPGSLTFNGTGNIINVTGGNFVAGNTYPLIASGTAISGSYTAGTLPAGVTGTITTSGNSIVLNVTAVSVATNFWTGLVNGTWDVGTTANWTNAAAGNTYQNGSYVQFDDTGINTATISNAVTTTLTPTTLLVTNVTKHYAFRQNTIIAGPTGITKEGTGNLTNSTPNTYTGPTIINKGAVVLGVAGTPNLNSGLGLNSAVTLANDSTAVLNLNNNATQIGSLAGGGPNAGNVVLGSGTLTLGVNNSSATYSGNISGTGGLIKLGTGTMTFGGTNTYTGATTVSRGTVTYASGAVQNATGAFNLGTAAGFGTTTMNVNSGSTVTFGGACNVGYLTGVGILNLNGGTFTAGGTADLRVGSSDQAGPGFNGYGEVNMTGGTVRLAALTIARGNASGSTNSVSGVVNVSGGSLIVTNDVIVASAGTGSAKLALSGTSSLSVGVAATKWLRIGDFDIVRSEVVVTNSATVNLYNNTSIRFSVGNASAASTNVFNQQGGSINYYSDAIGTVGGTGELNLAESGSANANSTYNLNGGTLTVPVIRSSNVNPTRTFNFNGGTLRAAKDNATFMDLGSGNARANVRNGGAIIDSNGKTITIAQTFQHSDIGGDAAIDGGLTKIGNGTLTLSTGYAYTGPTVVQGGTLALDAMQSHSAVALTVSNAVLTILANGGSSSIPATTVNLKGSSVLNLNYGVLTGLPTTAITASGSLTQSGSTVINVSASGLGTGVFPLITYTGGTVPTNNFTLGTLPPGIKAVLTNNTSTTLDLLVTGAGQLLTWFGAWTNDVTTNVLATWDINTSTNWNSGTNKYIQYAGNTYGDNVTFDDLLFNDSVNPPATNVNLSVRVVPSTVTANNSSYNYSITGTGGIDGAVAIAKTNTGTLFLATSNSYNGGTIVGGGTLLITNDTALGTNSGVVTLAGGALQVNGNATNNLRGITVTANSSIGVATNFVARYGGAVTGAGGLTKIDNGTLVLAGTNDLAGNLQVNQGTLTTVGTNALPAIVRVGNAASLNGVLTVPSGVFNANFNGGQFASSLIAGPIASSYGAIKVDGGTLNVAQQLGLGAGVGGYGALSISSGALNSGSYIAVGFLGDTAVYNQSGGTVVLSSNLMTIAAGGGTTAIGVANFSGGTFTASHPNSSGIMVGERGTGTMNVSGSASIITTNSNGLLVGPIGSQTGWSGTLNLNGGTVTANKINRGVGTGSAKVNFNGGTIKAAANNTTFLNGMDLATVYGGGLKVDDGGFLVGIPQTLTQANDAGVSSITLSDNGSGYIDSPIVTISGGSGSNATATATVSGGVVTAIVVTSPGTGYTLSDTLSVSFSGGGASAVAPTVSAVNLAANTSGGLTKQGAGTVTLSGANTYAGPTVVSSGGLLLTPAYQAGGAVVVSNAAAFGVSSTSVSNSATIGSLTMGSSGPTTLNFSYAFAGNPTNVALTAGAVTLSGTCTIHVGGSFSLGAFPVLKYTSLSGSFNSSVSGTRGLGASVSNDVVNKTIYVVVTSLSSPIIWTGNSPLPGKTNLWDLNSTTNWLIGGNPTTYQETLPPGDAVVFNDSGSSLVLLSNTASPLSVTISNNSVNYTFQGSGQINPVAGLTKQGAGTATLNVPGTYAVSTMIAAGTVSLGTNQTFANLTGSGTIDTASGAPTLTANSSTNTTFSGAIQGGMGVTKTGNSTLTLTGTSSFTGNLFARAGTIVIDNGAINNGTLWTSIGQDGTDNATLTLKGTGSFANNADFNVGDIGSATGTLNISNSANLAVASMYVASANAAASTASGTVNQSGGTVSNTFLVIGGRGAGSTNGVGVYNLSGGSVTSSGSVRVGGFGTGTMNISGTASASFIGDSYVGYRTGKGALNMTGGSFSVSGDFRVAGSDANGTQYNATGMVAVANATVNLGSLTIARGNNFENVVSGEVHVNSGATLTSTNDVVVGYAGTGYGKLSLNGGTVNVGTGVTKWLSIPRWDTTTGEITITNGSLNLNSGSSIKFTSGNTGTAGTPNTINQTGGTVTFYSDFATTVGGGGDLDLQYSGAATVVNTYNLNGGTLTVPRVLSSTTTGTRVFNFNGGTLKAAGSSLTFFNLGGGSAFANVLANGAIIDTAGYDVHIGQALINNGVDPDGGLTKNAAGALYLNGLNTYTNVTTVNAGTLGGSGMISGPVVVTSGGTLAPGASIGTLTISNNLTLAGNVAVEVNTGVSPSNDLCVVIAGTPTYTGSGKSVIVTNLGPALLVGDTFKLFSQAVVNGNLLNVTGGGAGVVWTNKLAVDGTIAVLSVSTVSTNPPTLTNSVSGSTLTLSWAADHLGWTLQKQTNSRAIGLRTNWFDLTGSESMTTTNITIDKNDPTVFYRLRYTIP